jgi:hypothetical protein
MKNYQDDSLFPHQQQKRNIFQNTFCMYKLTLNILKYGRSDRLDLNPKIDKGDVYDGLRLRLILERSVRSPL